MGESGSGKHWEKEERGNRGRIAMSVKKVMEAPENHEERLTRGVQGLKSIRTNYRGRGSGGGKHRQMGQAEGQKDRKGKEKVTAVDSPTGGGPA